MKRFTIGLITAALLAAEHKREAESGPQRSPYAVLTPTAFPKQRSDADKFPVKMRAKWDGVPIAFDIYVMKKDGCTYDFVYMGDPTTFDTGAREFESFTRGFRTLPGAGTVAGSRG